MKIYRNVTKLKNIEMFYFDTKTSNPNETIICLHGLWGRAETWYDFIKHYGKNYRIIAPDQRGHGLSSKPDSMYTAEEMAEDVKDLIDFLNIKSAIIVGHSMGGGIAAYFTHLYPEYVKALAILDKSSVHQKEKVTADPITKDWSMPFLSLDDARNTIRKAMESDFSYNYFLKSLMETVEGYKMMFDSNAIALILSNFEDWSHLLPEIECLTLLIKSKGEGSVKNEDFLKMKSLIKNSMAFEMSHPDHNVMLANKEEFYGYFDKFLDSI